MASSSSPSNLDFMRDDITCPVCLEVPRSGPVFDCPNGHLICELCRLRLEDEETCPTCKADTHVWARNRVAERILDKWQFACKYAEEGCSFSMARSQLRAHEKHCQHRQRTLVCTAPAPGHTFNRCLVPVKPTELEAHFRREHPHFRVREVAEDRGPVDLEFWLDAEQVDSPPTTRAEAAGAVDDCVLLKCRGRHFLLAAKATTTIPEMAVHVWFFGEEYEGLDYAFSVAVKGSGILMRGPVTSVETVESSPVMLNWVSASCLDLSLAVVKRMSEKKFRDGKPHYAVTLSVSIIRENVLQAYL